MTTSTTNKNFYLISLGCSKNMVDSEGMASLLHKDGYLGVGGPDEATILIVNTCGFIADAREESIDVLRELAENKRPGQLLVAAGCLSQRVGPALVRQVPGLDGVIGTRRWMDIVPFIRDLRARQAPAPLYHLPESAKTVGRDEQGVFRVAIQGASAYLKIADGCRRPCSFCAIPQIKGTLVSRPLELILEEARQLEEAGVKEIIIISQDSTDYGHDLGMRNGLSQLLEQLVETVPNIPWLRIMYAYQAMLPTS